jgi:hypothetical protein
VEAARERAFTDKIFALKLATHGATRFPGEEASSTAVDTPIPFGLKKVRHDPIDCLRQRASAGFLSKLAPGRREGRHVLPGRAFAAGDRAGNRAGDHAWDHMIERNRPSR